MSARVRGRAAVGSEVREGTLAGGLPYLAIGSGPPVVVLAGLDGMGGTTNPTGPARSFELRPYRHLAAHRTVLVVRRSPGIAPGCTMAQLASQHAQALARELPLPVDVVGVSTGASIGLQLALDHPGCVRRLVLLAGACRLSDQGRAVQRTQAALVCEGHYRRAMAATVPAVFSSVAVRLAMRALVPLTARRLTRQQADDLVRTIDAEDAFDLTGSLDRIGALTLVVGGTADGYYGSDLFSRTAADLPHGTLRLLPGSSHAATVTSASAAREILEFLQGPDAPSRQPSRGRRASRSR
ncbi:alpha/beta fold hydrolase [Cellulomonas sp.]|uniref:alpha/beta fold hydrolase n=1 Tax=Cellulomonas sp. TaxID=40001 RepID=UPI003BAC0A22